MPFGTTAGNAVNLENLTPLFFSKMLYFAYGADMSQDYLEKNGVHVTGSIPARLSNHYLSFEQIGLPYWEPSFATLSLQPVFRNHTVAHGVVHQVSQSQFLKYSKVSGIYYGTVEKQVSVQTYDGQSIEVMTLVASPTRTVKFGQYYPSVDYMKSIIKAAGQNQLKNEYREFLLSIPSYKPETNGITYVGRLMFSAWFQIYAFPVWTIQAISAHLDLNFPEFVGKAYQYCLSFATFQHEFLFKHLIGDGSGRIYQQ